MLLAIFALGYLAIVFEHPLGINKSASALLAGVLCWVAHGNGDEVGPLMAELSQILFFLIGAMTIVELIDAHDGFEIITRRITTKSRRKLLVAVSVISFVLSSALNNLTTAIVMMSLVRKLCSDERDRMYFGGAVIIATNAGGAWSPIGDVTTTMLWLGGQVTPGALIARTIVPSLVSLAIPLAWFMFRLKGDVVRRISTSTGLVLGDHTTLTLPDDAYAVGRSLVDLKLRSRTGVSAKADRAPTDPLVAGDVLVLSGDGIARAVALLVDGSTPEPTSALERNLVFFTGVGVLLLVPAFKTLTHLPPFMGMLLGLAVLWTLTELVHKHKNDESKGALSVAGALQRVDTQSILFFLGILLAIGALASSGKLAALARHMNDAIGNVDLITMTIGLSSAIVDNVPLVAAAQGMYPLSAFGTNHSFWIFLAYCAGTGGSILIIGSAAGIAVMGMQRISFGWYLKRISGPALVGYVGGALAYLAIAQL